MNMMKMMKQAASLQQDMKKMQDELAERTVEFSSGGGMVTATAKGDMTIQGIRIAPDCVDPEDIEILEDLVLAAVDGALKAARDMASQEMSKLTQGMGLPAGMNLPI
jgi:nucleoid-associated protein EbfC